MTEYCSNFTAGQYRSRILWQNAAALQQDSTIAENAIAEYHYNTIELYNNNNKKS